MTLSCNCLAKEVVSEAAIVGMIVVYVDSMRGRLRSVQKGNLGLHSFNDSSGLLEINVSQPTIMINEDYCDLVSLHYTVGMPQR